MGYKAANRRRSRLSAEGARRRSSNEANRGPVDAGMVLSGQLSKPLPWTLESSQVVLRALPSRCCSRSSVTQRARAPAPPLQCSAFCRRPAAHPETARRFWGGWADARPLLSSFPSFGPASPGCSSALDSGPSFVLVAASWPLRASKQPGLRAKPPWRPGLPCPQTEWPKCLRNLPC